jgi:predicted RNA binding protein YcfA (HicA-like mRNA interferase family)
VPRLAQSSRGVYLCAESRFQSVYKYTMKSRDIFKATERDGWMRVAQKGSHVQFKHPRKPGRVTVPHSQKDVPIGALRSIAKQAGVELK